MIHTPGPWKAVDVTSEKTCVYRRIDAGSKHVGFAGAYKMKNQAEALANARLIAVAPRMYEYIEKRAAAGDQEAAYILDSITKGSQS